MDHLTATPTPVSGPILEDWTSIPNTPRGHRSFDVPACADVRTLAPFDPEWTLDDVLGFLGDDERQHDPALQHPLLAIEQALTGQPWRGVPSTVSLIRSISDAVRRTPAARSATLARLLG